MDSHNMATGMQTANQSQQGQLRANHSRNDTRSHRNDKSLRAQQRNDKRQKQKENERIEQLEGMQHMSPRHQRRLTEIDYQKKRNTGPECSRSLSRSLSD